MNKVSIYDMTAKQKTRNGTLNQGDNHSVLIWKLAAFDVFKDSLKGLVY